MTPTCRDFALAYLAGGWSVFPVVGKVPAIDAWTPYRSRLATQGEADLWWPRHDPNRLGVALVCGRLSGVAVLDGDRPAGVAALRRLAARGVSLARTGSGGLHAFHRWSGEGCRPPRIVRLSDGAGIDLKGEGGYVVVPPSCHPNGQRYRWERISAPLPPMPPWVGIVRARTGGAAAPRREDRHAVSEPHPTGPIHWGTRHQTFLHVAGGMHRRGADAPEIAAELRRLNDERCSPPFPEPELVREIDGIVRALSGWSR